MKDGEVIMSAFAFITVDKGDVIKVNKRGLRDWEYVISYNLVNKASDLGKSPTHHMTGENLPKMIDEAKKLAVKFRNKSIHSQITVSGCGNFNTKLVLADDGRFYKG